MRPALQFTGGHEYAHTKTQRNSWFRHNRAGSLAFATSYNAELNFEAFPTQGRIPMHGLKGISLITVMVIVAILAVIAAFAIPAWRNQVARDHVADALKTTDAAKLVVMEAATTRGGLARIKTSDLDYNPAAVANEYVAKLEIGDGGRITLTTKNTGAAPAPVLVLIPSENTTDSTNPPISWSCTMIAGPQEATPQLCREAGKVPMPPASTSTPATSPAVAHS